MDLAALIRDVNEQELVWALLVEHADGRTECIDWTGNATVVSDLEATREEMSDWLLGDEPVSCQEAVNAGIDVLNNCDRCAVVPA